jgi:hypothetical protein
MPVKMQADLVVRWRRFWRYLVSTTKGKLRNWFSAAKPSEATADTVINVVQFEAPQDCEYGLPEPAKSSELPSKVSPPNSVMPVKTAAFPAKPPSPATILMALRAPHPGSGVACPECGGPILPTIDDILATKPVICFQCGLRFTLDVARSHEGLDVLRKLKQVLDNR